MKVHSWKTLLVTIFVSGGGLIYQIIHFNDFFDLVWLGLFAYLIIQGLRVSFSKESYDEDIKRVARGKRVYRKLFGRFAPLAPYGSCIFILLGGVVAMLLPTWEWLILVLLLSGMVYAIWLFIILKKHMRIEEVQEFLRNVKTK